MSWLLFLDESGHDHKVMPYEVRGGVAIHASELWPFVQAMQRLELDAFGTQLSMAYPVQAADLSIYCVNWGFRLPQYGMNARARDEVADEFGPWLNQLQYRGEAYRDGKTFQTFGIVYVPDPYTGR